MVKLNMNEPDEGPRRYKWPWILLAAVILFIALAILWVSFAVRQVERERNPSAPVSTGAQ